ncbi:MAG: hypothetical protein IJK61_03680 [Bacteroidetes bacterium]|nr:hypothetical protein [Bacteroidota bacterium]
MKKKRIITIILIIINVLCISCKSNQDIIKDTTINIKDVETDYKFQNVPSLVYDNNLNLIYFENDTIIYVDNTKLHIKQKYDVKKNLLNTDIQIKRQDTTTIIKETKEIKKEIEKKDYFFLITAGFLLGILGTIFLIYKIKK